MIEVLHYIAERNPGTVITVLSLHSIASRRAAKALLEHVGGNVAWNSNKMEIHYSNKSYIYFIHPQNKEELRGQHRHILYLHEPDTIKPDIFQLAAQRTQRLVIKNVEQQ